ncbi:MAG: leucine-rich repeat protein [Eubacteriales bacterium]|nr:leucine-rich repeat protein [Eubacteriales bacterium]
MKKKTLAMALVFFMAAEPLPIVYGADFSSGQQESAAGEAMENVFFSSEDAVMDEIPVSGEYSESVNPEVTLFPDEEEIPNNIGEETEPPEEQSPEEQLPEEPPEEQSPEERLPEEQPDEAADIDIFSDETDYGDYTEMEIEEADIFTAGEQASGIFTTETFRYMVNGTEAVIVSYLGSAETVVIPERIGEYTVTGICEKAFMGSDLSGITLPAGLKSIGAEAFSGCAALKKIELPAAVSEIGENAFASCPQLVLYCYAGTYAQQYAEEQKLPYELLEPEIKKTDIASCSVSVAASKTCTGKALKPAVKVSKGKQVLVSGRDYTVKYKNNVDPGTATVTVTGKGNYEGTVSKAFKITLAAPKLVSAASASYRSVKVTWKKVPGAKSYTIYYKGNTAKSWKKLKSGITGTSYKHTSSTSFPLVTGKKYAYTVKAVNGKTISSCDKTGKSAIPSLTAVKLGTVKSAAYNKLKITWSKAAGASGYYVYRKSGNTWKKVGSTTGTSFTHTGSSKFPIKTGTTYTYTVKAYRKTGKTVATGSCSRTGIKGKTVPDKPVLISAECTDVGKITIRWKKAAGATNYLIYRKNSKGNWEQVANVKGAKMIGYTHVSSKKFPIVEGKTYTYTVRSYTTTGKTKGLYDTKGKTVKAVTAAAVADAQLRKKAQEVINRVTTPGMTQDQKLRACWYFIMATDFHPWAFPDTTKEGWRTKCAMDILTTEAGNCYGFAHGFAALARELGYEPYVIEIPKVHCFVRINGGYWDNMGNKMGVARSPMSYTSSQITKF